MSYDKRFSRKEEMEVDEIVWPKKTDRAFRPDGNRGTNVCFGWLEMFNLEHMVADSFKSAADLVVEELASRERPARVDAFLHPVAYLYRHYLELKLKNVLNGGILLEEISVHDEVINGHSLYALWVQFRRLVMQMQMGTDPAPLDNTERVILDFHQFDKSGQAFRYPKDKKGKPMLKNLPEYVGLCEMRDVMGRVHTFLDGCEMCMDAALDNSRGHL
jgi:hypothetical protein